MNVGHRAIESVAAAVGVASVWGVLWLGIGFGFDAGDLASILAAFLGAASTVMGALFVESWKSRRETLQRLAIISAAVNNVIAAIQDLPTDDHAHLAPADQPVPVIGLFQSFQRHLDALTSVRSLVTVKELDIWHHFRDIDAVVVRLSSTLASEIELLRDHGASAQVRQIARNKIVGLAGVLNPQLLAVSGELKRRMGGNA